MPKRDVKGFPGYTVDIFGTIKNERTGKNLIKIRDRSGFFKVAFMRDGKIHRRRVHNIVAAAFLGPRPGKGYIIKHRNHNVRDNRVGNLIWDKA